MFLGLVRAAVLAAFAMALAVSPARAQIGSDRYAAIVLDHRTGAVLAAAHADERRHPASLTKMMTVYMIFEALRDGRLQLNSPVPISAEAASRPPSKLGVPAGNSITVEQAILALVTRSANDVAAAVGERLGGSEERFAQTMTMRARALGMTRTTFRNASGLPDPEQVTTARDMATLGRRLLQDFPERYHYFGVAQARFGGVNIRNHNRMLESYEGVDGIKTGYIHASGFNIVTSASRGGQRVVGAVFGGSSWVERDQHMATLLDGAFASLGVQTAGRTAPVLVRQAQAAPLPAARGRQTAIARQTATTRQTGATRQTAAARQPVRPATSRVAARNASASQPSRMTAARAPATTQRGGATATRSTVTRPAAAATSAARTPPAPAARATAQGPRTPQAQPRDARQTGKAPATRPQAPAAPVRATGPIRTAEAR